jgi:phage tail sheath gpL-like
MKITVAGPAQRGGIVTVWYMGSVVELEVAAGESAQSIANRLAILLNSTVHAPSRGANTQCRATGVSYGKKNHRAPRTRA